MNRPSTAANQVSPSSRQANRKRGDSGIRLEVVARPSFDRDAAEAFLASEDMTWRISPDATDAENLIEMAGRLCYLSFGKRQSPKSNREYIRHLIAHEHESVLEHASWSFILANVSRGFSHQFVRHRAGFAFSQMSQQYVDHSAVRTPMPEVVKRNPEAAELWSKAVDRSQEDYRKLLQLLEAMPEDLPPREHLRLVRGAARTVLPAGAETKLLFSANARALRHFLSTRGSVEGDEEMRLVSAQLLEVMRRDAPSVFEDFSMEELADRLPVVRRHGHDA
jgi:thymidylate synthase (FAD)